MHTVFRTILDTSFQVLCRRHWCRDLRQNRPKRTLARILLVPCHRIFTGSTCGHLASKPSKTTCTSRPILNLGSMEPLAKKYQINKRKSRDSPTQTWIALGTLLTTYNIAASLSCTAQTRTILDTTFQVLCRRHWCRIWAHIGQITLLERIIFVPWDCNFTSSKSANGKTRLASKTSKTTSACWLASSSRSRPLAMKCQIDNQRSRASLTQLKLRFVCTAGNGSRILLDHGWMMAVNGLQLCRSHCESSDLGQNGPKWPKWAKEPAQWHSCDEHDNGF